MWLRFQIGSNRPLAKRKARMFWRRLLPQEVVDPVDLLLGEGLVERGVEGPGAGQVGAEGLLHDDPRPVDEAGLAGGSARRSAPRPAGCSGSAAGGARLRARRRPWRPPRPARRGRRPAARSAACARSPPTAPRRRHGWRTRSQAWRAKSPELLVGHVVQRGGHDAAFGDQAGAREVEQAREQLPAGEVPGGPEQHDDVRPHRGHQGRDDVAGIAHDLPSRRAPRRIRGPGCAARVRTATARLRGAARD